MLFCVLSADDIVWKIALLAITTFSNHSAWWHIWYLNIYFSKHCIRLFCIHMRTIVKHLVPINNVVKSISVQTTTLMFQITILGSISGSDFYNKSKHIHVIFLIWNTSDVHLLLEKQTNKQKIPNQHKKPDSLRTKVKYLECKLWLPVFTWTGLLRDPRSG